MTIVLCQGLRLYVVLQDDYNRAKKVFELNERVFAVLGVWPLQSTYVKFTIWTVYLLIHLALLFADLFDVFGNVELMILNLIETTMSVMVMAKLLVTRFSETLAKLTRRVIDEVDSKPFESTGEMESYLIYNRIAKRFFKLWLIIGMISASAYILKPLRFRLQAVLSNKTMPFVLSHRTRLFFEVTESSTFWLVYIYQLPMWCLVLFHPATIAYLFTLVLHVCGQLSALVFRIKNLDLNSCDNHESARILFHRIVNRHHDILGIAKDINDVFGLILLEELVVSTILIGLTCYSVLKNVDLKETEECVSFLVFGFIVLFLMYGYCVAGEYLIVESANLCAAYYDCQWYVMSDSFKKQLRICMIGANRPVHLTGGGFYVFSLFNFTQIVKTSAGYISMLRTMTH